MGMRDELLINGVLYKTGDKVTCNICGREITSAAIYINGLEERQFEERRFEERPLRQQFIEHGSSALGYICQNVKDGWIAPDQLGYFKSWAIFKDSGNNLGDYLCNLQKLNPVFADNILKLAYPMRK